MRRSTLSVVASAIALSSVCAGVAGAQAPSGSKDITDETPPAALIKECNETYGRFKSYDGNVGMRRAVGNEHEIVINHIRAIMNGVGLIQRGLIEQTSDIATHKVTSQDSQRIYEDSNGTHYVYDQRKEYAEVAGAPSRLSDMFQEPLKEALRTVHEYRVYEGVVEGRLADMMYGKKGDAMVMVIVDKKTMTYTDIHVEVTVDGTTRTMDAFTKGQVIDQPIEESVFAWRAPAGYTKVAVRKDADPW
jgi:hypothetical protein